MLFLGLLMFGILGVAIDLFIHLDIRMCFYFISYTYTKKKIAAKLTSHDIKNQFLTSYLSYVLYQHFPCHFTFTLQLQTVKLLF